MADLLNINMTASEVVAALGGDFSVGMTATEFVGEVNTAFPDADAELTDTATELVGKVNNAQPSPIAPDTKLTFLHYSDPHGQVGATNKAYSMMTDENDKDYDADIDFTLLTGDYQSVGNDALAKRLRQVNNGKHFVTIGNHDAQYNSEYSRENHALVVSELKGFMADGENSSYVNFGDQTGESGYWYKDFFPQGLPKNGRVRVIGVDEYEYKTGTSGLMYVALVTSAQIQWLYNRINELTPNDYFIIATHQPPFWPGANPADTRNENNFCWSYTWGWDSTSDNMAVFSDIVRAYKEGAHLNKTYRFGLTVDIDWSSLKDKPKAAFLCFPCGHVHADFHAGVPINSGAGVIYENMLVMCIDTSKRVDSNGSDFTAQHRADNQYAIINKVTIDFHDKTIRIDRIGCKNVQAYGTEGEEGYIAGYTRDNIVFDFDANVKSQNGVEEGGES